MQSIIDFHVSFQKNHRLVIIPGDIRKKNESSGEKIIKTYIKIFLIFYKNLFPHHYIAYMLRNDRTEFLDFPIKFRGKWANECFKRCIKISYGKLVYIKSSLKCHPYQNQNLFIAFISLDNTYHILKSKTFNVLSNKYGQILRKIQLSSTIYFVYI